MEDAGPVANRTGPWAVPGSAAESLRMFGSLVCQSASMESIRGWGEHMGLTVLWGSPYCRAVQGNGQAKDWQPPVDPCTISGMEGFLEVILDVGSGSTLNTKYFAD